MNTRDTIAHVVGGRFHIALAAELDGDARTFVGTGRGQFFDAFDTGNLVFDNACDFGFDYRRGCAAIGDVDADDGRTNVRIFAHRQAIGSHQADDGY
jgi:hypothetical protein